MRQLRDHVTDALLAAGFDFDPNDRAHRDSRNETRYTIFRLPYAPVLHGEGILRPEIQIELTVSELCRPFVVLPLHSFVAEAFGRPAEVESLACVSVTQTAAEKFVSLTRRTAAEIADPGGVRDSTLIRHIHDLHITRLHYDPEDVAPLIQMIARQDALTFGNQFPAYRDNPLAETRTAISAFQSDPGYAKSFEDFQRLMVYGELVDFASCLSTLERLAQYFC